MSILNISTPGVYINEVNAFSNSVNAVATAVPAFIGYTPNAFYQGKSYNGKPTKISSFFDFQAIYCLPDAPLPASTTKQYNPQYYLVKQQSKPADKNYLVINGVYYVVVPDPNTIYYLYNSIRLFYQNGGGDAYIVSVGSYGAPSGKPANQGEQVVNPNILLHDLQAGLQMLLNEDEPTMYICPDATLLSINDNATLMHSMLMQNAEMETAISIFDIIGGKNPDPVYYTDDIKIFRENVGTHGLNFGAAYYPFVATTIMQANEIDYTNIFGGDLKKLASIINPEDNPNQTVAAILNKITSSISSASILQCNTELLNASSVYKAISDYILTDINILPPSGGMAGIITTIDSNEGVWQSPANTSIVGVVDLPIKLSESQQANLNVDAVTGKSINAIRFFNGIGILVWGARTLDGNSMDWKYISVRRTMIMLEQSCKRATQAYVFQPNTKITWETVNSTISSFLTQIWKQGGIQGANASEAFSVDCGLGITMTSDDILDSFMRVTVKVAIARPGEFIVFTFQQQQVASS